MSVAITAVVSCAVSFITRVLHGWCCGVLLYCEEEIQLSEVLLSDSARKQQQQSVPVYEGVIGQFQNIELKENVIYGPVQQ